MTDTPEEDGAPSSTVDLIGLWEDERQLAIAMLEAFAAGAFDKPPTQEDVTYWEEMVAECDGKLAAVGNA
jgi:hypothetical protein